MLTDLEIALQFQCDEDDEMYVNSEAIARLLKEQETEMSNTATYEEIAILMQQEEVKAANDMARSHQLAWQLQEGINNESWPAENLPEDITRCQHISHELAFNLFDRPNVQLETAFVTNDEVHAQALSIQIERSDETNSRVIANLIQQEEAELAEARSFSLALQLHEEELRRAPTNNRERPTTHGIRPNNHHHVLNSHGTRPPSRLFEFPTGDFYPRLRHSVPDLGFFQAASPYVDHLMMRNLTEEEEENDYETLLALAENIGSANTGLTPCEASMLPSNRCTAQSTPSSSCNICLSDYSPGDEICTLPCVHVFHKSCIGKWLEQKASCPVCRLDIKVMQN